MTGSMTTQELRTGLSAHLDTVTPPPGDLDAVLRRSRARRARRIVGPGLLTAAAVGVGALVLSQAGPAPDAGDVPRDTLVAAESPLDLSQGLRAFAAPDERLYLGGTSIPLTPEISYLDTDAVATPYDLLYTDPQGRVQIVGADGTSEPLTDPSDTPGDWHPTIKADAERPVVAWAALDGADIEITVYDLEQRSVVATTGITCPSGCHDLVIDGIDSGAVFLRLSSGTSVWDYDRDETYRLAGRDTRVADVRNRVVLYDGVRPSVEMKGWRYVSGAIDAQLSFDGRFVLYWSDELTSTAVGGTDVIKLDLPVPATFFAFDTDGSVLAATAGDPSEVFDCEIPGGTCEKVGEMSTEHGDPMFIGNDM